MAEVIYHIAYAAEWEHARAAGSYELSTRGRTLREVGFIHASRRDQVAGVAHAFYAGERDLVVLVIDETMLTVDVREERPPGSVETFPHIYGPLDVNAVVATLPLEDFTRPAS